MISELTREGCEYVIRHMRDTDRRTIFGLRFTDSVDDFIESRWANRGTAWQAERDGEVHVIGGICNHYPEACALWLIGTPSWRSVMVEVTRFVKHTVLPRLAGEFHRIEAVTLASDQRAVDYSARLGFECERIQREVGRYRENYFTMAIINGRGRDV